MQHYLSTLKNNSPKNYRKLIIAALLVIGLSIALGSALGKLLSLGAYVGEYEALIANDESLPSRVYDINNNLITEISQGSRELLAQNELTRNLIYSLLGREDSTFFEHNGFSLVGTLRAFTYLVLDYFWDTGRAGGGSTLTQQLAGSLKADRTKISVSRKIRELWWSFIFEKYYAKSEILVTYLNHVYFGERNTGIEAASRFFFGHTAKENSIVESVLAVIQLARPNGDFSPLRNPEMAKLRQNAVLDQIVDLKLMTRTQVEEAKEAYWESFDLTKVSQTLPKRIDQAPYFSDYVARSLENQLYGTENLLQAGYSIYTTLDLNVQKQVNQIVEEEMSTIDTLYDNQNLDLFSILERQELPELARLRAIFGLNLDLSGGKDKRATERTLQNELAPTLEALVISLGLESHLPMLKMSSGHLDKFLASKVPETAMLAIENSTGNIVAMVGGRNYNINEARIFNRALDAGVPSGSSFKPLYVSAAMEEKVLTAATMLADAPYRFVSPNGEPYIPANYYAGKFKGKVLPRRALQLSLNIPIIHVLEMVGFDKGIGISTKLLGITDPRIVRRNFPFVYPVALGTAPIAPVQLLRAYSTFANKGIPVEPNPIRYVEDRNGQIIFNYEQKNIRRNQDASRRILSEQTAYVMTKMLESVPAGGTLSSSKIRYENKYGAFNIPLAAKTGTAENWSDGWTVGYTPKYTTVVWVGFDEAGNSLGEVLYGGKAAGPMFMRVMGLLHKEEAQKTLEKQSLKFVRPEGVYSMALDKRNGYRWVANCGEQNRTYEWFIEGTGPTKECTEASSTGFFNYGIIDYPNVSSNRIEKEGQDDEDAFDLSDIDFLNESQTSREVVKEETEIEVINFAEPAFSSDAPATTESLSEIENTGNAENTDTATNETGSETSNADSDNKDEFLQHQEDAQDELDSLIKDEFWQHQEDTQDELDSLF